jgi:hypothetical protein
MAPTLTTLVPRLRPAIDGVGDYAWRIAEQLETQYRLSTHFIVGDSTWQANEKTAEISAQALTQRSVEALQDHLPTAVGSVVLLHYVPHGYAHKACPFWLIQALEHWRQTIPGAYLLTMFHELYACDWRRPWSSDFWLSPVQQHIAARLAQLSDGCLTSSQRYASQLAALSRGKHKGIPALPVFSNVGEPAVVLPWAKRQRQLVIFGQRHSKERIYRESLPLLEEACRTLDIQGIWDIGPTTGLALASVGEVPVHELGPLSIEVIGQYLSQARAGFLTYDPRRLSKSGIFAAYCAHGVLPINHQAAFHPVDGLNAGIHYWVPGSVNQRASLGLMAAQAHDWYQTHTLAQQVEMLYQHLPPVLQDVATYDAYPSF